jgi:LacI family transcriptional regulator
MASLKDIATELNVSVSLVSKVLNNRFGTTGARADLIEQIRDKAKELGYQRNHNALALLANRQNSVAVFIHRSGVKSAGFTEDLLEGIAKAARSKQLRLIIDFFTEPDEFAKKISTMHTGIVDGVIITGVAHPELTPQLREMKAKGLQIISIYAKPVHPDIPNVGLDDEELTYYGTRHLIEQGCKRIAHFNLLEGRLKGYLRALEEAEMPVIDELIYTMPKAPEGFNHTAGENAIANLLHQGIQFDGLSAQSDTQAFGAINELFRNGIKVPEQVKVVGVDNSPACKVAIVPLSSVSLNYAERGEIAINLLERAMSKSSIRSIQVSGEMIVRDSSRT